MELQDIKKSLSELSEEELRDLLAGIRTSRRTAKPRTSLRKSERASAKSAKAKSEVSIDALLGALSPEQLLKLMSEMGGK
jgi:hypothetical protein